MRPIPGTITDPRLTPLIDRDPGDEQPEPVSGGPTLTAEQWATVFAMLAEYEALYYDFLTTAESSALAAIRQSRV